jgi:hypothetical protein
VRLKRRKGVVSVQATQIGVHGSRSGGSGGGGSGVGGRDGGDYAALLCLGVRLLMG